MTDAALRRGDVVICSLAGDYGKPRPAIVVQSDLFNDTHASVTLCPVSSEVTGLALFRVELPASPTNGLRTNSEVMVDKISTAARTRITQHIGHISRSQMELIDGALRTWLALTPIDSS
jgi:mRNA interferase MazF